MPVIECDVAEAKAALEAADVTVEPGNTPHERWRASRGDATAVAYEGKVVIQGSRPADLTGLLDDSHPEEATLYVDGASRGNPGPAAVGWVLAADGSVIAEDGETIGRATNNQAEYEALRRGLRAAADRDIETISIRSDSELAVKQITGVWDTDDPTLREKRVSVRERLATFDDWELQHVPRELNERADRLANDALDDA